MQNGVFLVLFVEIFLFYTPFRETHIVRRLQRLSVPERFVRLFHAEQCETLS